MEDVLAGDGEVVDPVGAGKALGVDDGQPTVKGAETLALAEVFVLVQAWRLACRSLWKPVGRTDVFAASVVAKHSSKRLWLTLLTPWSAPRNRVHPQSADNARWR